MKHNHYRKYQEEVYKRDEGLCVCCGKPAVCTHHVIFRSHMGKDTPDNLVCLCDECHRAAHGREKVPRSKEIREELLLILKGKYNE